MTIVRLTDIRHFYWN